MKSDEFFLRAVRRFLMLMRDSRTGSSSGGMADMLLDTPDMIVGEEHDEGVLRICGLGVFKTSVDSDRGCGRSWCSKVRSCRLSNLNQVQ